MKKVKITAICAVILFIASASNNIFVSTIAGKLLTPYMIVGLIMAISAGLFGIYFGRSGGKALYAIVSAICTLTSVFGFLGNFIDVGSTSGEASATQQINEALQPIFSFFRTLGIVLLSIVGLIALIILVSYLVQVIAKRKNRNIDKAVTVISVSKKIEIESISIENVSESKNGIVPKIVSEQAIDDVVPKNSAKKIEQESSIKIIPTVYPDVPPCPHCGSRLESRKGPYGWFKACVNKKCGYTINWKNYRRQNPL